jgi:hypothetical protein
MICHRNRMTHTRNGVIRPLNGMTRALNSVIRPLHGIIRPLHGMTGARDALSVPFGALFLLATCCTHLLRT